MAKQDMLPGLAAAQLSRPMGLLGKITFALGLLSGAAYFATGSTADTVPMWLYALFALTISVGAATYFIYIAVFVKAYRESKAGYTTTGGMYPNLPQIDYETGEVLREVGQPLISQQRSLGKRRPK